MKTPVMDEGVHLNAKMTGRKFRQFKNTENRNGQQKAGNITMNIAAKMKDHRGFRRLKV